MTVEAHRALDAFGSDADRLREIADYLLAREF
jgi:hypothetical protein